MSHYRTVVQQNGAKPVKALDPEVRLAPSWGSMITDGYGALRTAPWLIFFPALWRSA